MWDILSETNPLRINLVNVGQSLCQNITRHLITKFVSEFSSLSTSTVDRCSGICYGSGHDTADGRRKLEDVRNRAGIDQFILYHHNP